jgi:hypothetical protein
MSYIIDHAIVVSGSGNGIARAHKKALKIFSNNQVSPILTGMTNGCESFFIAPDGSKEGWDESNKGDAKRKIFTAWLCLRNHCKFVEVAFGGFEERAEIVRSN